MKVDFGKTSSDYGNHRAGFPDSFFERLRQFGIGAPGQRSLDLGSGTGTVARGLAALGSEVLALDIAAPLLREAARLDAQSGLHAAQAVGQAERTPLSAAQFDVVAAGQCWHWFDRPAAAREVRRLLRPQGWLVIAHFDWIPLIGNVVAATEDLIYRYNPNWDMHAGTGLYPAWLADVAQAGFESLVTFSYDVWQRYSHAAWRGRIRASAGVAASLPPERVAEFDAELAKLLARRFQDDPLEIHHRVWALLCRAPR